MSIVDTASFCDPVMSNSNQNDRNVVNKEENQNSANRINCIEKMTHDIFVEIGENLDNLWQIKQLGITSKSLYAMVRSRGWNDKIHKLRKVWELRDLMNYRFNESYNFRAIAMVYSKTGPRGREDVLTIKLMDINPEESCWPIAKLSSLDSFWKKEGVIQINPRILRPISGIMGGINAIGEWISDLVIPKILAPFNRPMDFNPIR